MVRSMAAVEKMKTAILPGRLPLFYLSIDRCPGSHSAVMMIRNRDTRRGTDLSNNFAVLLSARRKRGCAGSVPA